MYTSPRYILYIKDAVCKVDAASPGPFGGQPVEGGRFFSLSNGPIHVHEAERSLDLTYENFCENKTLLLKKAVGSISRNGMDKCDHGTITVSGKFSWGAKFRVFRGW